LITASIALIVPHSGHAILSTGMTPSSRAGPGPPETHRRRVHSRARVRRSTSRRRVPRRVPEMARASRMSSAETVPAAFLRASHPVAAAAPPPRGPVPAVSAPAVRSGERRPSLDYLTGAGSTSPSSSPRRDAAGFPHRGPIAGALPLPPPGCGESHRNTPSPRPQERSTSSSRIGYHLDRVGGADPGTIRRGCPTRGHGGST
jgi:hypothetical protein